MTMIPRFAKLSALAGLVALATTFAAGDARGAYDDVYSAGHADVNLSYVSGSGTLHLNYDFGSNAVINGMPLLTAGAGDREADTITVLLGANALGTGPSGLPSPFAGNPLWTIPQTSMVGRPFLGIGAEPIDQGLFRNETLTLSLSGISSRPAGGEVVLWQAGNESNPFFNSADGFSAADHVDIASGGHDHYNYGFTKASIYDLNFTGTGTLLNGTTLSTSETYRYQVGAAGSAVPEPGSLTLLGLGLGSIGMLLSRRKKGRPDPVAVA